MRKKIPNREFDIDLSDDPEFWTFADVSYCYDLEYDVCFRY
jgi:hypothetical protein